MFSLENYREWERVVRLWTDLRREAEAVYARLRPEQRDAYYQLVLHPIRGSANLVEMNAAAARNRRFGQQGRASTNAEADEVRRLFAEAHRIRDYYNHELAGGKWNHLMDQTYIGYFDWYQPDQDIMPALSTLDLEDSAEFGLSVEGRKEAWPGFYLPPRLPTPNSLGRASTYIEVFPRCRAPVAPELSVDKPWVKLREEDAFSVSPLDRRYRVEVDWDAAPVGKSSATITATAAAQEVSVHLAMGRATAAQTREASGALGRDR